MSLTKIDPNLTYIIRPWGSLHLNYKTKFENSLHESGLVFPTPSKENTRVSSGTIYLAHFGDKPFFCGQFANDFSIGRHLYHTDNTTEVNFFRDELFSEKRNFITKLGEMPASLSRKVYDEFREVDSQSGNYLPHLVDLSSRTKSLSRFMTSR